MHMTAKILEPISCPLCGIFSSKRHTTFEDHLIEEHKTTSKLLWDKINNGPVLCACGCRQETKWINWKIGYSTMLKGHNGNIYTLYSEEDAKAISEKRIAKLVGKIGWSKGLTKETDIRVALRAKKTSIGRKKAFDEGKLVVWNKGITIESDIRVKTAVEKQKKQFASGALVPWAKGLTKSTDKHLEKMTKKVSETHRQSELRSLLDNAKRLKYEEIKSRIENSGKLILLDSNLDNYKNSVMTAIRVQCKTCNMSWYSTLTKLQLGRCFYCNPGGSAAQVEIADFVRSLGEQVSYNDRKTIENFELDIFVQRKNFAIEYNGLYWHSILNKSSMYHENKTNLCAKSGIELVHIFEDEWRDKKDVVKSSIASKLGYGKQISADECSVVELDGCSKRNFFSSNHLDGDKESSLALALISATDGVVACISFSICANNLLCRRFCCKLGTEVAGAIEKLSIAAVETLKRLNLKSLVVALDKRFGNTKHWYDTGWIIDSESELNVWWTDFDNRFDKSYVAINDFLSEEEAANSVGVIKIYGCKNLLCSHKI